MSDETSPADESDRLEHRYRFFADRACTLAFEIDRVLIPLFTGIIAGLLALLVSKDVGFWSALCFALADLAAIIGLGACLMHLTFGAKAIGALAAIFGGDENVPNLISREEPTVHAFNKNRVFAQICYANQLICLFWSVLLAGLGIIALVWDVLGLAGLILAALFAVGLVTITLRPLVLVYRLARLALPQQKDESIDAGDEHRSDVSAR